MNREENNMLFSKITKGDKKALALLFSKLYTPLLHYGLKISQDENLIEDCIQELFLIIFDSRSSILHIKDINSYMFVSFRRLIFKKLKQKNNFDSQAIQVDITQILSEEKIFENQDVILDKEQAIQQAIRELPSRQREVIFLKYYNKYSTYEIAKIMEISNQTVLNTLNIALRKIQNKSYIKRLFH